MNRQGDEEEIQLMTRADPHMLIGPLLSLKSHPLCFSTRKPEGAGPSLLNSHSRFVRLLSVFFFPPFKLPLPPFKFPFLPFKLPLPPFKLPFPLSFPPPPSLVTSSTALCV